MIKHAVDKNGKYFQFVDIEIPQGFEEINSPPDDGRQVYDKVSKTFGAKPDDDLNSLEALLVEKGVLTKKDIKDKKAKAQ